MFDGVPDFGGDSIDAVGLERGVGDVCDVAVLLDHPYVLLQPAGDGGAGVSGCDAWGRGEPA